MEEGSGVMGPSLYFRKIARDWSGRGQEWGEQDKMELMIWINFILPYKLE